MVAKGRKKYMSTYWTTELWHKCYTLLTHEGAVYVKRTKPKNTN